MRILFLSLLLITISAHAQKEIRLIARELNVPDSSPVKLIRNGDQTPTSETRVIKNRFRIRIPQSEAALYFLLIGDQTRPTELFLEPGKVVIRPVKGNSTEYDVKGSPAHADFKAFVKLFLPLVQQTNQLANSVNQAAESPAT